MSRAGRLLLRRADLHDLLASGVITIDHADAAARALACVSVADADLILDGFTASRLWQHSPQSRSPTPPAWPSA
ncbi:MAG: hypothetical protein ACOYEV_15690 [Candidatus Nanopelagicales bacterium]